VLPPSQREALRAALGLTETTTPEGYLVALAVLNLLAEVAETAPVLLLAEDAHWLDPSTADVLAFLGRRLESEPVVLLASIRNGIPSRLDEAGLPELIVPPLSARAAAVLLDAVLLDGGAGDLPAAVRTRLLDEAAGNPLALIELPAAVTGTDGATVLASPWLPLAARLERAFARRFAELPSATAAILEGGALNDSADLAETLAAASALAGTPVTVADLGPAVAARLIGPDESALVFHHPLVRSAVYQVMSTDRRRAGHRALAGVLRDEPDRRTWHLAAVRPGADGARLRRVAPPAAAGRRLPAAPARGPRHFRRAGDGPVERAGPPRAARGRRAE
jgi:predicted ATPase